MTAFFDELERELRRATVRRAAAHRAARVARLRRAPIAVAVAVALLCALGAGAALLAAHPGGQPAPGGAPEHGSADAREWARLVRLAATDGQGRRLLDAHAGEPLRSALGVLRRPQDAVDRRSDAAVLAAGAVLGLEHAWSVRRSSGRTPERQRAERLLRERLLRSLQQLPERVPRAADRVRRIAPERLRELRPSLPMPDPSGRRQPKGADVRPPARDGSRSGNARAVLSAARSGVLLPSVREAAAGSWGSVALVPVRGLVIAADGGERHEIAVEERLTTVVEAHPPGHASGGVTKLAPGPTPAALERRGQLVAAAVGGRTVVAAVVPDGVFRVGVELPGRGGPPEERDALVHDNVAVFVLDGRALPAVFPLRRTWHAPDGDVLDRAVVRRPD